jgi:hypothetical protein
MGTRVAGTQSIRLPEPSAEATVKSLRLIMLVSCLVAVIGIAVVVVFFLDPDSSTMTPTDGASLVLLLVLLPLSVALCNWWVLRRKTS